MENKVTKPLATSISSQFYFFYVYHGKSWKLHYSLKQRYLQNNSKIGPSPHFIIYTCVFVGDLCIISIMHSSFPNMIWTQSQGKWNFLQLFIFFFLLCLKDHLQCILLQRRENGLLHSPHLIQYLFLIWNKGDQQSPGEKFWDYVSKVIYTNFTKKFVYHC